MRVAHVITRLIVGGAQENTIATVLGLHSLPNVQTDLIAGIETGSAGSLAGQIPPATLFELPELVRNLHPWKDVIAWRKLIRRFRETRPDIVHTHSGKAGILGRLAAHKARVPVVIHTIHGPSFGPFQNALANQLFLTAERQAGKVTTHFISVAEAMTRQYLAAGIGSPDQYSKIFSGFDLQPFLDSTNELALRQKIGLAADDLVIGKIARLFKLKGHADLVKVAPALIAANPKIKFLLVGDGPERTALERSIRAHGMNQHFIFTGLVPPSEIAHYTGIMDLLVHLSLREGLPRALPQALAAGRPVVAYDCDGAKEVCLPDETGYLIAPGHLEDLKAKLLLLAKDQALRYQLGQRGRDFVIHRFSTQTMVDSIHALYQKLLAEAPSR